MELKHALAVIAVALLMLGLAVLTLGTTPRPRVDGAKRGVVDGGRGETTRLPAGLRASGGEDEDEDERAAKVFDFQNRLDEVRQRYESRQFGYAIGEAQALLSHYDLTRSLKAELHFLLSRCFRETGEEKTASHHHGEFRKLLDAEAEERRARQGSDPSETMRTVVERAEKAAYERNPLLRPQTEEDLPLNLRCFKQLRVVAEADVLSDELPEGGTIYFSRSGEALQESLTGLLGGAERVVIQRDPRFRFYFQIVEK